MTRWNVISIFFLSVDGHRREVDLTPGHVNVITGASGTGKSTLIKAIDYCLGSSRCELPAHVKRRSVAVGVKWASGNKEIITGRIIPPVGQATSTRMFCTAGSNLTLPTSINNFDGATTLEAGKAFIERAFGIGDIANKNELNAADRGRATVRHVTPYIFVTKEVIDSEAILLHGLEKADKARDIVSSVPYFLRAADESSAIDERRLSQLRRALAREEAEARSRDAEESTRKQRATSLLAEANRIGINTLGSPSDNERQLLSALGEIVKSEMEDSSYPTDTELETLQTRRREILSHLETARRQSRATRTAIQDATGFEGAVLRQREKLMLSEHLRLDEGTSVCPVCDAPSERGKETSNALRNALSKIRAESIAVDRVKPRLVEHDHDLSEQMRALNTELRQVDDQIRSWMRQTEEARQLADVAQLRAHLLGRISYFLESNTTDSIHVHRDLDVLRAEIEELEARVDREAKRIRLKRAERKISQFASEAIAHLPTVAPCVGSELEFASRIPEVAVIEANSGAVLRMPDVGSDQNYLAIHIALAFALQRHFEIEDSPVPGLLVFDQISRPYFPTLGEDADETEIDGDIEDEEFRAMRQHIDFLFAETARRTGLQVLLIEHAYFADDHRYVNATKERWTRASGQALIPMNWSTRDDA